MNGVWLSATNDLIQFLNCARVCGIFLVKDLQKIGLSELKCLKVVGPAECSN
jgi:hypothetical protein